MLAQALFWAAAIQVAPAQACAGTGMPVIVETFSILPFATGSAELSPVARTLLDGWLATVESRVYPTRFELIGQADRVGTRAANRRLSWRRADAVRRYLVRGGVPRSQVEIRAEGEDRLLVDTADGVPEAQNRIVQLLGLADPREARPCLRSPR